MSISAQPSFLRKALFGIAAAALVSLAACGGGGDGDKSGSGNNPSPTPTTGKVAILLTDGATDDFCQILADVERIDLLGTYGSPTNVFMGPETVDILDLRNYTDFFAIDPEVPIGTYEKVRMTSSDLARVECDDQGMPEGEAGWEHPKLPGNGRQFSESLGINPARLSAIGYGETKPIVPNDSPGYQRVNRRVEIILVPNII